jgi:hypothetical protein
MAPFLAKDTCKNRLHCLKVKQRLIDIKDDQRTSRHIVKGSSVLRLPSVQLQ